GAISDDEINAAFSEATPGPMVQAAAPPDPSRIPGNAATEPKPMGLRLAKEQVDPRLPPDQQGGNYWGVDPGGMTVQEWGINARRGTPKLNSAGKPLPGPHGDKRTQVRLHSEDPSAPKGSPSGAGWTMNIVQGDARMLPDGTWFDAR